jgi:hypothetical protein
MEKRPTQAAVNAMDGSKIIHTTIPHFDFGDPDRFHRVLSSRRFSKNIWRLAGAVRWQRMLKRIGARSCVGKADTGIIGRNVKAEGADKA